MRIVIAQGGGPTAVINQSLVGAVMEAKSLRHEILGSRYGISGITQEDFVDLHTLSHETLERMANTPSSALGSTRDKPDDEYCRKILAVFRKRAIDAFLYIGGNDSSETIRIVSGFAEKENYPLKGFHIPKTVDNDLMENDHTPGWASAARFVAKAAMGIDRDNAALPGLHLMIIMGRHAGFLTCAASLGKKSDLQGPHLTYIPEHHFCLQEFVRDVESATKTYGRCVCAISEGIQDASGTPIINHFVHAKEYDAHGNAQLSSLPLGDALLNYLKEHSNIKRVRQDTFGYVQRSYPDPSKLDQQEARECGKKAVELLLEERKTGSVVIKRASNAPYTSSIEVVDLELVANKTRHLPKDFYNQATKQVTRNFFEYALPLVGDLPENEILA